MSKEAFRVLFREVFDEDGNVTECHGMEERDWEDTCRS